MSDEEKIVITSDDLAERATAPPSGLSDCRPLPLWWRLLTALLVLCPPLLFPIIIGALVTARHRSLPVRHAHAFHYCCLLLVSGLLWTTLSFGLLLWSPLALLHQAAIPSAISLETFPLLPSTRVLSGREIAQELSPLVVVVHRAGNPGIPSSGAAAYFCGAGALAFAGSNGCLVVTSRHVIDALTPAAKLGGRIGVTLKDGQCASAVIAGLHRDLDLALLWVARQDARSHFIQPMRRFRTVEVGEQVYVIGHPEGLAFSLSAGLVAQTRGKDIIQISAPVSPGNSGGPVYDPNGRLVAIIQSVIDKAKSPNAENLNFAVRTDDILDAEKWALSSEGRLAVAALAAMNYEAERQTNVRGTSEPTPKGD